LNLRNVTIEQWNGTYPNCTAVYVLLKSGNVTAEESKFHNYKKTRTTRDGALHVFNTGGESNIAVSRCSFKDAALSSRKGIIIKVHWKS